MKLNLNKMLGSKSKIVCACLNVNEAQILEAIHARRIKTVKDIIAYTSAGEGCTACHPILKEYLERELPRANP
ncbi:MAG: (2Fe-2S)-binding protein [Elusimicrobia bacterium]|nr:(2Fe-2S)-binding protein [Elusimicrobiota bacterium]